jgi:hypothetical protein
MHFEKDERCIEREMKRTYALYFVLYTKKFKHLLADYCYPYSMYIKGSCFQKNYIYVSVKKKGRFEEFTQKYCLDSIRLFQSVLK